MNTLSVCSQTSVSRSSTWGRTPSGWSCSWPATGWWKRTDEIYEPVRIGEGLMASGKLGEEPMRAGAGDARCVLALLPRQRARERTPWTRSPRARSATRRTRPSFLRAGRASCFGLPIRVLSREQEAHYGYLAAVNSTTLRDGSVLDLGGGSMQLVHVVDRLARDSGSWRLGTVRMSERFLPPNGPAKRKQLEELREHVAEQLARCRRGSPAARERARRAPGGHRRDRAQPRRRRPARRGRCPPTACRAW